MIAEARRALPERRFELADIAEWSGAGNWDLVFSNAALQWVPDHAALLPRLMRAAAEGGALAFQVPAHFESPVHLAMVEAARHPRWNGRLDSAARCIFSTGPEFYYDTLRPLAQRVDLWFTVCQHVMAGPEAIIEWMRGTGMRPHLDALADHQERERFEDMLIEAIRDHYPLRADGNVLFPFRRLFVIACR
jgi:trans-aconitate 2-methyltransferase